MCVDCTSKSFTTKVLYSTTEPNWWQIYSIIALIYVTDNVFRTQIITNETKYKTRYNHSHRHITYVWSVQSIHVCANIGQWQWSYFIILFINFVNFACELIVNRWRISSEAHMNLPWIYYKSLKNRLWISDESTVNLRRIDYGSLTNRLWFSIESTMNLKRTNYESQANRLWFSGESTMLLRGIDYES